MAAHARSSEHSAAGPRPGGPAGLPQAPVAVAGRAGANRFWWMAALAIVVLGSGGAGYRWLDRALIAAESAPIRLERPLSTLPLTIGDWQGTEVALDDRVIEVAGCDDYTSRRYVRQGSGQAVNLYVAYAARPAKMLSHRPQVCYPSSGWSHVSTARDSFRLPDGRDVGCLIHRFRRAEPTPEEIAVLNYYVIQGRHATDWTDFWGPKYRLPNLSRNPSFYVAQVQISTVAVPGGGLDRAEETIRALAAETAPLIESLLPAAPGGSAPPAGPAPQDGAV